MAQAKPKMPHPGKVSTQVFTISMAIDHFTDLGLFAAPTPMMAVVLVCVVETGKPRRCEHKTHERGEAGGESLERLELHHVHAHGLDDALAAHGRTEAHVEGAEDHEPHGHRHARQIHAHAGGHHDGQHEDGHELLAVLGAVHESHPGARADLRPLEERVRLLTVHMPAQPPDELVVEPAQAEAEQRREQMP